MDAESAKYEQVSWKRSALVGANETRTRWRGRARWVGPLVAILSLIGLTAWAAEHIHGDMEDGARSILERNGIEIADLEIDPSFRNVDVSGTLPEGVTAEQVKQLLEEETGTQEGEDIRNADVSGLVAAPAAALGAIDAQVTSDGETIVLTGTVPTEDNKADLIAAAESTGLPVDSEGLTASVLQPSSGDADGQIQKMSAIVGGLGAGTIVSAALNIGDEGPVTGRINAIDQENADLFERTAGDDVTVTAPAVLGALDTTVEYDGSRIVLDGTVLTEEHSASLEAAAGDVVGADNVVNNLEVSGLDEAVENADGRVGALAGAIGTFGGLNTANAMMNDTDLTVNGVAGDEESQAAATAAVSASEGVGLRPGGEITIPEISLAEEIDLLQAELDALQEEIRVNVVFASDSDVLTPNAQATLDKVIEAMVRYPRPVVEVGGHTDSQGNDAYNQELSQRRAQSVVDYVGAATSTDRLQPVGYGESQPIGDNSVEAGRLQNRRVEFTAKESF